MEFSSCRATVKDDQDTSSVVSTIRHAVRLMGVLLSGWHSYLAGAYLQESFWSSFNGMIHFTNAKVKPAWSGARHGDPTMALV
jgi:hypothetical protein